MTEDRFAFTIAEFCKSHGIGRATFYTLPPEDRPATMLVGKSPKISIEAAAEWRRRMETKALEAA